MCNNYYKKSKDCATAGDYSNCMVIKLGKKAYDIDTYICQIEGSVVVDHLTQMGFGESLTSMNDMYCCQAYADLDASSAVGYRPQVYDSMKTWLSSLDWQTTPFLYGEILDWLDKRN